MNNYLVLKFGGTQLKDASSVRKACNLIASVYEKEKPNLLPVVVSAPGKINDGILGVKVTDLLERIYSNDNIDVNLREVKNRFKYLASSLEVDSDFLDTPLSELERCVVDNVSEKQENKDRSYSAICGFGERVQVEIIGRFFDLAFNSLDSRWFNFNEFGMITNKYRDADALSESLPAIEKELSSLEGIVFLPGFVGCHTRGELTTLGRDGSNYTATKVAEALLAREVRIYSDEPGVRRADPLLVPDAEIISELTYEEAREFAELGAKIINPRAITPAQNENIPIFVVDENRNGTRIYSHVSLEHMGAKIIASVPSHRILTVHFKQNECGLMERVSNEFKKAGLDIASIADEGHAVSIAFSGNGEVGKVLEGLGSDKYYLENNLTRISLIGEGMRHQIGVLAKLARCYADNGISIEMASQSKNQLNISTFIENRYERMAVRRLYDAFFRD
ncbi:MAG: aspartate kinase [Candidatus Pacearchaeota archaeon]